MTGDRLHGHMAMKNIKLYAELQRLENADPKKQLVHGLQREMRSIGRVAIDFMRNAESISLEDDNANKFPTDLERVAPSSCAVSVTKRTCCIPCFFRSESNAARSPAAVAEG